MFDFKKLGLSDCSVLAERARKRKHLVQVSPVARCSHYPYFCTIEMRR